MRPANTAAYDYPVGGSFIPPHQKDGQKLRPPNLKSSPSSTRSLGPSGHRHRPHTRHDDDNDKDNDESNNNSFIKAIATRGANSQVENTPAVIYSIGDTRVLNWKKRNIVKSKWSNDSTFSESYDIDSDTITIINQLDENPCSDKNIKEHA